MAFGLPWLLGSLGFWARATRGPRNEVGYVSNYRMKLLRLKKITNMKLLVETMRLVKMFVTTVCVLFLMTKRNRKDAPDHNEGSN